MNDGPQLRYKITSDEWVLVSPKRSKRLTRSDFKESKKKRAPSPVTSCPFENPQASGNNAPHFWYPSREPQEKWTLQVFENKYPALTHAKKGHIHLSRLSGLYRSIDGVGYHDLLVTREHHKNFPDLSLSHATDILRAFVQRYREMASDPCVRYVSIFQNWGESVGGSVYHPHYQIIGMPVVPSDVERSLRVSERYYRKHKRCLHCKVLSSERKEKKRVIYENKDVIAFVPFAAKEPFEVTIAPKRHSAYFEDSSDALLQSCAQALGWVLLKIRKNLHDSDYNFFLHTAPAYRKKSFSHYHWHFEIVPRSNISAGFELGTGVEINPVLPEEAARVFKKQTLGS